MQLQSGEFKISLIQTKLEHTSSGTLNSKRYYIPLTFYSTIGTSFFSTYDESLDRKNNAQYTLSFSINKYNSKELNPLFYLIVENRRLRLETDSLTIDFIITSITPKVTKNNTVLSVTCQDVFSYDMSKQNISISYNSIDVWQGPVSIGKHATKLLQLSLLDGRYDIVSQFKDGEKNNIPMFPDLLTTDYINHYNEVTTTMELSDVTPYAAFTQLCNDYNALLKIYYPETVTIDDSLNSKTLIGFSNLYTTDFNGYIVRPETNITNFSVNRKTDNFCSILRVSGGEDLDGLLVSLMPSMTVDITNFFTRHLPTKEESFEDFWNKSSSEWKIMFFEETYDNDKKIPYYDPTTKTALEQQAVESYWKVLCQDIKSGGSEIFRFDYYVESGLLSIEDKAELDQLIERDMRNANIKNYLVASQYHLIQSELNSLLAEEQDYIYFIAADNQVVYNNQCNSSLSTADNILDLKQLGFIKESNLSSYGYNHSYLEDLLEVWSRDSFKYIRNTQALASTIEAVNLDYTVLNVIDTNKPIGQSCRERTEDNYNFTIPNTGTTIVPSSIFTFNYLGIRATELLIKYQNLVKRYIELEQSVAKILNDHKIDIPIVHDLFVGTNEELYSPLDNAIYSEFCVSLSEMQTIVQQLDECFYDNSKNIRHYRLGIIGTYLNILYILDNMYIDPTNKYILLNSINNRITSGPTINLEFAGINNSNLSSDVVDINKHKLVWTQFPVLNLQSQKDKATEELQQVWSTLYNCFGDYICESKLEDSDQISQNGLYTNALKQLSTYTQPTVDYSTTIINSNEILGFTASLELGDIIHFYNQELSNTYNGRLAIETNKINVVPQEVIVMRPKDNDIDYKTFTISKVQQLTSSTVLYLDCPIEEANDLLTIPFNICFIDHSNFFVINKWLDTKAKPIPLQVTGINTKLRDGTSQITVSNNKIINNLLGKMLRQVK